MIWRKSYFNGNECNNVCHAFAHHANTNTATTMEAAAINGSNDLNNNNNNSNDGSYSNSHHHHHTNALSNAVTDEMDNISLEVLWEPQSNGKQIKADIVFIHGLHGKQCIQLRQSSSNRRDKYCSIYTRTFTKYTVSFYAIM